ncbi:hypothetical protein [Pedobacter nutrimenti]|uniref:hypothetical protein n=1 Tax=Pedobacter nutrimenti TaxID=1241337 RepID=UPI00292F4DA3|nr:hypothetical protein [Pedobacter nutrimenti]
MRTIGYILLLGLLYVSGCKNSSGAHSVESVKSSNELDFSSSGEQDERNSSYPDGDYCASIDYYNPSTGTSSTYTLDVEVENGELIRIDWPNGGWLDSSHFTPEEVDEDGHCSFTTYDGKQYEIQIDEEGGCGLSGGTQEQEQDEDKVEEEPEDQSIQEEQEESENEEEVSDLSIFRVHKVCNYFERMA